MTPVPVFTPSTAIGGVEMVARHAQAALTGSGLDSPLHVGLRGAARSSRPRGPWMALTWKTQAAVCLRHPGVLGHGLLWLHGAELTRDGGHLHRYLRTRVLTGADVLLAVSPLAQQLLPPDLQAHTHLVGPPIPSAGRATAGPARDPGRDGTLRLLSVGRAVPRKGHDLAIEVAALLSGNATVELDVVGPGPDLPRLRDLAARASRPGLTVNVRGPVTDAVKEQLYADADALLFLPRSEEGEYEGLGLVVLEAAARGCPAVVLDCGGSRYGVAEGRSGTLLPAGAPARDIADAVHDLTARRGAREAAASFARQFELAAWQRRVCAASAGERLTWRWPSLA